MSPNFFIKNILSFAGTTILLAYFALCGDVRAGFEDRRFEDTRLELGNKIERILIEGGICKSIPDCYAKQVLFASPDTGGVRVAIYWAVDDAAVLRKVHDACVDSFFADTKIESLTLNTVLGRKEEEVKNPFWVRMKIGTTIEFRRNK